MGAVDVRDHARTPPGQSPALGQYDADIQRLNEECRKKRHSYRQARSQSATNMETTLSSERAQNSDLAPNAGSSKEDVVGTARPPRVPGGGRAEMSLDNGLAAAAASGCVEQCRRILASTGANVCGPDGTTPLCAAAMWGHAEVVRVLLEAGADPAERNRTGTRPTALHAAALQEHGKVCMRLLEAGADPLAADGCGVTPQDYATCSEALWPLFAAAGCERSLKEDLIAKNVIRRASTSLEEELQVQAFDGRTGRGVLPDFSRPGSSYVVTAQHPPRPGSAVVRLASRGLASSRPNSSSRPGSTPRSSSRPIDILGEGEGTVNANTNHSTTGLKSLGL